MTGQEKVDFLVLNFRKLDEKRKDCIRELTRKLVEIHSETDFQGEFNVKKPVEKCGNNSA